MGYPTKMQVIQRGKNQQWCVNFPSALARAMDFVKSEVVEWEIIDKSTLVLKRTIRRPGYDTQGK